VRRTVSWFVPGALLLVLAAAGCSAAADAARDVSPTADRPAASATQVAASTPTDVPAVSPSPTRQQEVATLAPTKTLMPPSATPSPPPTKTLTRTPAPPPSATPTATPTPTPTLRRLTQDGCCTQPFWSPDSRYVLFIDQPAPDAPLGIWGVDITATGSAPELLSERIALYTTDLSYVVTREGGETVVERLDKPLGETVVERWTAPSGGRSVSISPGRTRIAWRVSDRNLPVERRVAQVWVADLDGSDPQMVATLARGGLSGWLSDDVLLLSGRDSLESRETVVFTQSLTDGKTGELVRAERPRGMSLSPDGRWLLYYVSLSDDPAENGAWLLRTDGSERRELDPELFGAYQWRDANRLLLIPFRPEAEFHELWELSVETGEVRRVADPDVSKFKVANGDWQVSPDGRHVVFVESGDRNIWLLTLSD